MRHDLFILTLIGFAGFGLVAHALDALVEYHRATRPTDIVVARNLMMICAVACLLLLMWLVLHPLLWISDDVRYAR